MAESVRGQPPLAQGSPLPLAALVRREGGNGRDLAENRADAGRDAGHKGAGSNRHETRHQRVLDEVLSSVVVPDSELRNRIHEFLHWM